MFRDKATKMEEKFNNKIRNKSVEMVSSEEPDVNPDENKRDYAAFSGEIENPFKIIKKELTDLINIYEELGIWSFTSACLDSLKTIKRALEACNHCLSTEIIQNIVDSIHDNLFFLIRQTMSLEDQNDSNKILEYSSEKVNCLIEIFRSSFEAKQFHAIVFVERKYTAYYLDQIMQKICSLDEFSFIKSDYVFGNTRQNTKEIMNNAKQVNREIETLNELLKCLKHSFLQRRLY